MAEEEKKRYDVFHRTWWKEATSGCWPNGLEPGGGEVHYLAYDVSYEVARQICADWNRKHDPGRLSDRAEFWEAGN